MGRVRGVGRRACVAVGAVALTVVATGLVVSVSAGATGGPALTAKGTTCTFAFSSSPLVGGQGVAAIKVENGQNVVLKCTAPRGGIVNETGRTQIYRDFMCSIRTLVDNSDTIYVTTNSSATVTGDGGVQTTCAYSKPRASERGL